ncbi:DUF4247 domain-containing protein [Oceanobacillus piezotolerans]|uniref:DUF4247 domain-containing protein n=2 Tax=Oceanobacillus piezotolerans TaxID=2448030 RepID=A0A498DH63_9BACI|nr:DUF4247 domain-containing protein [Oceanobacillus piezotolerans]
MSNDVSVTKDDIPNEPDKDTTLSSILSSPSNDIDDIIEVNFPLIDVVSDNNETAEIYATTQFSLSELSEALQDAVSPQEVSEVIENQQILIYPEKFVTLGYSESDDEVLLIEVASENYARENYSPSFLQTYFGIRLLDSIFGNNWSSNYDRDSRGSTNTTPSRGNTTFRGGGPGSGK